MYGPASRARLKATAEALIVLVDELDTLAEDLEPEEDWEPWLAPPEGHER